MLQFDLHSRISFFLGNSSLSSGILAFLIIFAVNSAVAQGNADSPALDSDIYVQVQVAKLRESPKQWATGIFDVKFGDKLVLVDKQNAWLKVRTVAEANSQAVEGYLHSSAVTGRRVLLSASTEVLLNTKVDEQDVYLAGKGFCDEVVAAYASEEPGLDFAAVETMKKQLKPEGELLHSFIVEGKLIAG